MSATLKSGVEVEQRIEADEDGVVVVTFDATGHEIGRVAARRRRGHAAAELSAWTNRTWRRQGVASAAMDTITGWAMDHRVPFLVGAVPTGDERAVAFLRHGDLILSTRTDGDVRRFALAVHEDLAA